MALTPEWRARIIAFRDELRRQIIEPICEIALEGFVTREHLDVAAARRGAFTPTPPGTAWGAKWEYGWFRGQLTVPQVAPGQRAVLRPDVGGESAVFLDGALRGAQDLEHREIPLHRLGPPGTQLELLIEAYAGHGPRPVHAGPTPPERLTVPEPGPTQTVVRGCALCLSHEETYQLWLDVEALLQLRDTLDPRSLRVAQIDAGLRDFTLRCDPELPRGPREASFAAARAALQPLLQCKNGSTAPTLFLCGHAHIDLAWLWPLAETERKAARTFATQLALLEDYPEYHFLQSQPHLYRFIKDRHPDLYQRVRAAAATGRWIADGAMWIEADTNLPSGESLIRQLLHGKRFLREELGVDSQVLWLPDVFGYSAALPQILRGCGVRYFASAKLFWAYSAREPFPYNSFTWEGVDGSQVLVHLSNDYCSDTGPAALQQRWTELVQRDGLSTRLVPFGFGDGGGGPTREHLELLRRQGDLEGAPRTRQAPPLAFFEDLEARGVPDRYVGELYFASHRGTYTSQARTKRGNRRCEVALREAELWSACASALAGAPYPTAALAEAWLPVLLNQFHDILPGSSIARVHEEAEAAHRAALAQAEALAGAALDTLCEPAQALTLANSLGAPRRVLCPLPAGFPAAQTADGQLAPQQRVGAELVAEVLLPPFSLTTLRPAAAPAVDVADAARARAEGDGFVLENQRLRLRVDRRGALTSVWDQEAPGGGRELLRGLGNELRMYRDVPASYDAWDLDSPYLQAPVPLLEDAEISVLCDGPLLAGLRVRRQINQSLLTQEITLQRGSRRVDFRTQVQWQERHKLLKVAFDLDLRASEALHEIQFGHLARPNHASRPGDADRFEVPAQRFTALREEGRGAAVLNDGKYGVSVLDGTIALSLLRAPLAPDMRADLGLQEFTYALYSWNGGLLDSALVQEAAALNTPPLLRGGVAARDGAPLFQVDAASVILETVKLAEDGSGDVILRLYESGRSSARCRLRCRLPHARVQRSDMLEAPVGEPLPLLDGAVVLTLAPFEICTLRLGG